MFLNNLDALMAERKINKNVLAKESGIPYTTIDGFYKKGWDNVKLSTLLKLAEYFGVSIDWLVLGNETEAATSGADSALSDEEKNLLESYRTDDGKKALFDKVLSGEITEAALAAAKKSEPAPATVPVRRQRRKDDIIIF